MNQILLRYVVFTLAAAAAGAGGGYLAVKKGQSPQATPPAVVRSGTTPAVPAQPTPGQGTAAVPASPATPGEPAPAPSPDSPVCPTVPYHRTVGAITSASGITANVSLYPADIAGFIRSISGNGSDTANRVQITSLTMTKARVLLAAGSDYLWNEFRSLPAIYRSTDQGKTWATAAVPTDSAQYGKYVLQIAEDASGVLWAVGKPGVLKSTDGGLTWTKVAATFTPYPGGDYFAAATDRDLVRNVLVLADNSVVITVPFYVSGGFWGYAYTNVYRTTDGGASWSLLFTQKLVDIITIAQANDGALVFTDQDGKAYRFSQGTVTEVFRGDPRNVTAGPFLKTRGGALYYILNEEQLLRGVIEVVPTVYRSGDHGVTWREAGHLPSGSSLLGPGDLLAEGGDGRIYLAAHAICSSGTIYQSSDQGRKWEVTSGNVPGLSSFPSYPIHALEAVGGNLIHGGNLGGVVFSTP